MRTVNLENHLDHLPQPLIKLQEIAYNLWWSWHPAAQDLFQKINPEFWTREENPVRLLQETPAAHLTELAGNENFLAELENVHAALLSDLSRESWLSKTHHAFTDQRVIYLSCEFGFHESLPIYSGGLGVLAGDHTKSASDLGIPFVGLGLLYKNGYFRQEIDPEGQQHAIYPEHDFSGMPVRRILDADGNDLCVNVELAERTVYARAWLVQVGRSLVLLLDTDFERNAVEDRGITRQLYGGDREMRIQQEIILGIGGVRLLRILEIDAAVWHLNEGHVAFSVLERLRECLHTRGCTFAEAAEITKAATVFTTHTPVPAGNEAFSLPLMDRYLRHFCRQANMPLQEILKLGLQTGEFGEKFFSMTVFALRLSCRSNGVSQLHGDVSQRMWAHLWPEVPSEENPITSITNGIHTRTWLAPEMARLFTAALGEEWPDRLDDRDFWQPFEKLEPGRIRETRHALKMRLIDFVRTRLKTQYARHGAPQDLLAEIDAWLDPGVLTIGFARRFATYKRATLIVRDRERLNRLINHPERPVQLIFAGKAHPADRLGQELIRELWHLAQQPEFRGKIVLLENYDMRVGRHLVQGVDVWLNTPRRPQEASGTSGQKVPINGGINCSVLDGWWPEAYDGRNGWRIGDDREYDDIAAQDRDDAESLYRVLEDEIVPLYYGVHPSPERSWPQVIKASLRTTLPVFNTEVMVKNYFEKLYRFAIEQGEIFSGPLESVRPVTQRKALIRESWPLVHFAAVQSEINRDNGTIHITADLYTGELAPDEVCVELYCIPEGEDDAAEAKIFPLDRVGELDGRIVQFAATAETVPNNSGNAEFKLRVFPVSSSFLYPHELGLMHWKEID